MDVTIIGCGVSGLTCGVLLAEQGLSVEIVAEKIPPYTTSDIAPAIWYPHHARPEPSALAWARRSREVYTALAADPLSGVSLIERVELFDHPVGEPWWREAAGPVEHRGAEELPPGYLDAWVTTVPLIESPRYLQWLLERFRSAGGSVHAGMRLEKIDQALERAPVVVNCSGLDAGTLCDDPEVFPVQGQALLVTNPGIRRAMTDRTGPLALTYIVPRSNDCLLGGTAIVQAWSREPHAGTTESILARCRILEPSLGDAELLDVRVGLRPGRHSVRVERENRPDGRIVVHDYGHAGAGYTLAWGCAEEVLRLITL